MSSDKEQYESYKAGMEHHSVEALLAEYKGTQNAINHYTQQMNKQYNLQSAAAALLVDKLGLHSPFRDKKIEILTNLINSPLTDYEKKCFNLLGRLGHMVYDPNDGGHLNLVDLGLAIVVNEEVFEITGSGRDIFESEHPFIKALVN